MKESVALSPRATQAPWKISGRHVRRIFSFLLPYWPLLCAVLVLQLVGTALGLAYPLFAQFLVDRILLEGQTGYLVPAALVFLAVTLVGLALGAFGSYLYTSATLKILFDLRMSLFSHLQGLSLRFFRRVPTGEILARLSGDLAEVQSVATGSILSLVSSVLALVVASGFLLWLHAKLFLASCVVLPAALWVIGRSQRRVQQMALWIRERSAELGTFLVESFGRIKATQAMAAEELERRTFSEHNRTLISAVLRYQIFGSLVGGASMGLLAMSSVVVFGYGGFLVAEGVLTLGGLVAFAAYQGRVFGPLQGLMGLYLSVQRASAALRRVFEFFDLEPEVADRPDARAVDRLEGEIRFRNVSFAHPGPPELRLFGAKAGDGTREVISKIDLSIPAGSFCAIVGPNGAGKTTLVELLFRFFDPQQGSVEIDGTDIRAWKLGSFRRHMALVTEDPVILGGTVRENLLWGIGDVEEARIKHVLEVTGLAEVVERLPRGPETELGERGLTLSAGERQKIALARALLRRPAILVLDEATAALDMFAEGRLHRALREAGAASTVVVVTHRLHAARRADKVIVLDEGRLVEEGTPERLALGEGLYQRMVAEERSSSRQVGSRMVTAKEIL